MCGRFTLNSSGEALAEEFDLAVGPDLAPRFNIAPSQEIAVVREDEGRTRECALLRWGLVASWVRDPKPGRAPINARSESACEKPTFRRAMAKGRCLVPASGFYEWQASRGGPKQPFLIRMRDSGLFSMAGLHETWCGPGGEIIESVAILTTAANALMEPIHARMPLILAPADHGQWLDRDVQSASAVTDLMLPCPEDWLEAVPIGTQVNNPRFDDPSCIEPLERFRSRRTIVRESDPPGC